MKTFKALRNLASAVVADFPVAVSLKEGTKEDLRHAWHTVRRIKVKKVKEEEKAS